MKTIRRRRREGKTDYQARLALLKSEKPRMVVRKTNRYMIAQIVGAEVAQDKVIVGVSSKDLLGKGWPKGKEGSLKNRVASYLTGYYIAKLADKKRVKEANLDIGLNRNIHKSRIYAVVKGAIDGGLKIPCNEKALPSEQEINKDGKVKEVINKIKKEL